MTDTPSVAGPIAGLLLAAGKSRRFGTENKLLTTLKGKPLACHSAEALLASDISQLYAVCDDLNGPVADLLQQMGYQLLLNRNGTQSASLRIGAIAAVEQQAAGLLVSLADMPFLTGDILRAMITTWRVNGAVDPLAAFDGAQMMPPVIFGKSHFAELARLPDAMPGKTLLADASAYPLDPLLLRDVDTYADMERLL
jgi:molybdenum cofactor cytidylyltransferase